MNLSWCQSFLLRTVYYTVNGDPPDRKNGTLYSNTRKIPLDGEGEYEIQAVCRNAKGIYSEVVTSSYVIRLLPPEYATVTPDGGRFSEPWLPSVRRRTVIFTIPGTERIRPGSPRGIRDLSGFLKGTIFSPCSSSTG